MADGTDLLPGPSINTSVLRHEEMAGAEPRTSSEAGRSCCLWLTPTRRHCLMYGSRAYNLHQRHSNKGWVGLPGALLGRQPRTTLLLRCSTAPPAANASQRCMQRAEQCARLQGAERGTELQQLAQLQGAEPGLSAQCHRHASAPAARPGVLPPAVSTAAGHSMQWEQPEGLHMVLVMQSRGPAGLSCSFGAGDGRLAQSRWAPGDEM